MRCRFTGPGEGRRRNRERERVTSPAAAVSAGEMYICSVSHFLLHVSFAMLASETKNKTNRQVSTSHSEKSNDSLLLHVSHRFVSLSTREQSCVVCVPVSPLTRVGSALLCSSHSQ